MRVLLPIFVGATLLAGTVPAIADAPALSRGETKLAETLAGRQAGEPVNCLNTYDIQSSQIIDRTAIVYRAPGNKIYVNRPEIGRESLRSTDVLVTKLYGSRLCSIDMVHLYDSSSRMPRGVVGLGKFVPYVKPAKAD